MYSPEFGRVFNQLMGDRKALIMSTLTVHDSIDYNVMDLKPDELAFHKAIAKDRHSDLPRLVYCDWLEEQSEKPNLARFIRLQIERNNAKHQHKVKPKDTPRCPACALDKEIKQVWQLIAPGDTPDHPSTFIVIRRNDEICDRIPIGISYTGSKSPRMGIYRRGFIDELKLTYLQWVQNGDYLYEHLPITKVQLSTSTMPRYRVHDDRIWLMGDPKNDNIEGPLIPPPASFSREQVQAWLNKNNRNNQYGISEWRDHPDHGPFQSANIERAVCELRWPGVTFKRVPLVWTDLPLHLSVVESPTSEYIPPGTPMRCREDGRAEACSRNDPAMIGMCEETVTERGIVRIRLLPGLSTR